MATLALSLLLSLLAFLPLVASQVGTMSFDEFTVAISETECPALPKPWPDGPYHGFIFGPLTEIYAPENTPCRDFTPDTAASPRNIIYDPTALEITSADTRQTFSLNSFSFSLGPRDDPEVNNWIEVEIQLAIEAFDGEFLMDMYTLADMGRISDFRSWRRFDVPEIVLASRYRITVRVWGRTGQGGRWRNAGLRGGFWDDVEYVLGPVPPEPQKGRRVRRTF